MDQRKNSSASKTIRVTQDTESVFMENIVSSKQEDVNKIDNSFPTTYSRFLFDPRDIQYHSSGNGHRRNPSYESRESTKSVSDCSYVSGSPCESPGLHEFSLQSLSSTSSTPPYSSKFPTTTNATNDNYPFHSEKDFVDYLLTLSPTSSKNDCYSFIRQQPVVAPSSSLKPVTPVAAHQGSPQIGLDHLENLCKLMEQLGELREHNSKLQKRVQYLEEMRNLNELRNNLKEVLEEASMTSPKLTDNRNTLFTFNLHDGGGQLATSYDLLDQPKRATSNVKLRQTSLKHHSKQHKGRSQSMGDDDISFSHQLLRQNTTGHKAKISKWAKVKEALKWERVQVDSKNNPFNNDVENGHALVSKASITLKPATIANKGDAGSKSDNEDAPKQKPTPVAPVKYLQKTDTMREIILPGQTVDSQTAQEDNQSKERLYETESSSSDDESLDLRDPYNKRASLGSNVILRDSSSDVGKPKAKNTNANWAASNEPVTIDEEQVKSRKGRSLERNVDASKAVSRGSQMEKDSKKMSKGAWGKVKTILQTRKDSLKRKHRKSGCIENVSDIEKCGGELLTGDDLAIVSSDVQHTPSKQADNDSEQTHPTLTTISYNHSLENMEETFSSGKTKYSEGKLSKPTKPSQLTISIQPEESRAKASTENIEHSPTYQSKWRKMKKVFHGTREDDCMMRCQRPQSVPASPSNLTTFRYDDFDFLEEYLQEANEAHDYSSQNESEDNIKMSDRSRKISMPVGEKDISLAISVPSEVRRQLEDMQRNVTEDFTKKMQEWERLKSNYAKQSAGFQQQNSPRLDRKTSSSFSGHKSKKTSKSEKWEPPAKRGKEKQVIERDCVKIEKQREKELQWLEKQLQKIEREKQRLAKERQKYLEREAQLEKMRATMMKPATTTEKKEILIKTSAGEFRFEGISETFTRKLHEWETMRGIGPEVSTLTLLDNQIPSKSTMMSDNPDKSVSNDNGDLLQVNYNSLAPPVLSYGGHFNRLKERNRSHSESSLANMANVQTSTTSLVMCHDNILNTSYITDNEIDTDSSSINAFSCSKANSEPEISCSPMLIEGGPCAMEVEQMHIEESIPCLEIPAVPVEEPVYSYAPMEVTQLIDSSNSSDSELEIKIIERQDSQMDLSAVPQHYRTSDDASRSIMRQNAVDKGDNVDVQLKASKIKLTKVRPVYVDTLQFGDTWDGQNIAAGNLSDFPTEETRQEHQQLKKIAGVNKVKEISAEIIQQAKTLEQTLMEKNVTIRQLQWELLQREMSNKRFWSELEKVTGQVGLPEEQLGTNTAVKAKSSHQRSWSAVEPAHGKSTEEMDNTRALANQSPLELIKITEKPELSPTCLADKVKELKSELKNLWGSQESSNTSICLEMTDQDSWPINQNEVNEKQQSTSSKSFDDENTIEILSISKPDNWPTAEAKPKSETVAIRRVSDTVIPSNIQLHSSSRISKLPMSPKMNRSKSLSQNSTPVVSRKRSLMSPRTTVRSQSQTKIPAIKSSTNPQKLRLVSKNEDVASNCNQSPTSFPRKLTHQNKLSRESSLFALRRQNAEDYGSSSDSDSESSNVGYTVHLDAYRSNKSLNSGQLKRVSGSLAESPRPDYVIKHSESSSIESPWNKISKEVETEELKNNCAQNDEKLSAPSTPIVRSRSTRKLKPPTANKLENTNISEIQPSTNMAQSSNASPLTKRRNQFKEKAAPNVQLMIEKFNKKMDEANNIIQSSPSLPRSQLNYSKTEETYGLKKSTSFSDSVSSQYIEENDKSKSEVSQIREHRSVIKSASASVIERGAAIQYQYSTKPPMSPEATHKKFSNSAPQAVGIASRIPRCLTAICERDNSGSVKTDNISDSVTSTQRNFGVSERLHEKGSPKLGSRALELKRAKENFLTRNSSTSLHSNAPTHSGWRSCYQRSTSSITESIETELSEITKMPKTNSPKFKGILKPSRAEPVEAEQLSQSPSIRSEECSTFQQWFDDQTNEDLEDELIGSRIVKSASAGAMDFAANYGRTNTKNDARVTTQTSTDSNDKNQKSTCGLFNFKFRRPKLSKHKKTNADVEALPTVKTLCRQSLLVDFDAKSASSPTDDPNQLTYNLPQQSNISVTSSKSCPSSPETRSKPNVNKTSTGHLQNKSRNIFKSK